MTALARYLLGAMAICLLDLSAGREITLWLLYVVPVGISTWNLGRRSGYLVFLASALLHVGSWAHDPSPSPSLAALIILASRLAVLVLVIELVSALRRKEVKRLFHPTQSG